MRYFYFELGERDDLVRHITFEAAPRRWITFPDRETNLGPERTAYLEWLAGGNEPELWQPQDDND